MKNDETKYESPTLEVVGTLEQLTLGKGWRGDADNFTFIIDGHVLADIDYGRS